MSRMKALIAEDNAQDRKVLRYYLEAQGAEVTEAADGAEGFDLAMEKRPDLIISDALMPKVDGFQFLKRVRSTPELLGTPFIFYSAVYTGEQDQELAVSLGADAFIIKPKDPEEFWHEVRDSLDQAAEHRRRARDEAVEQEAVFLKKYSNILAKKVVQKVGELQVSEQRFRDMIEKSPDWFWEFDRETSFTYVSPQIRELLGYEPQSLLGKKVFDLISTDEAEQLHRYFDPGERKYLPFSGLPHTSLHKNGRQVIIESSGTPIFSPAGEFAGYRGIDRDITERKRAEEALRQSEKRYRTLYEHATVCIHEIDLESRLTAMNPAGLSMLGVDSEEEIRHSLYLDMVCPAARERVGRLLERAIAGEPSTFEFTSSTQDARVFSSSFIPLSDPEGNIVKIMGVTSDITERKRINERLEEALAQAREARDKYDSLLKSIADAVIIIDSQGRLMLLNRAAEELLGISAEEALGRPIGGFVSEKNLVDHLNFILASEKNEFQIEIELVNRSRMQARSIQALTSVAHDSARGKTGVITILHDVTPERESDRLKSEFISTAAHELRTPLTSVLGYAELLLEMNGIEDDQQRECLATIVEKSLVLERIIDELLDLSRLESGRIIHVEKAHGDLKEVLEQRVREFEREYPGHRFILDMPQERIPIWMDEGKIVQVIENLLGNSIKFSAPDSLIKLSCDQRETEVRIVVQDEGIGMTPEQLERVFNKFYRADASDTAPQGLGLGMTIVKGIIEAHDGRVWVESEFGRGTKVCFTLPIDGP